MDNDREACNLMNPVLLVGKLWPYDAGLYMRITNVTIKKPRIVSKAWVTIPKKGTYCPPSDAGD